MERQLHKPPAYGAAWASWLEIACDVMEHQGNLYLIIEVP